MRRRMVFIADQCNAVGKAPSPGKLQLPKDAALEELIRGVSSDSRFIFAASSNQTKVDVFSTSMDQDKAVKILVPPFT